MRRRPGVELRGVVAVAATYTFFLLWAQYGFLALLRQRLGGTATGSAAGPAAVRGAMAAMGVGGLLASLTTALLLAPRRRSAAADSAPRRLAAAFVACAVVAPAALAVHGVVPLTLMAAALGVVTAVLTVTLAADLRRLLPGRRYGLAVGLGTGVAYLACNLPLLFEGTPAVQGTAVAVVCLAAAGIVGTAPPAADSGSAPPPLLPCRAFHGAGFAAVVLAFLALVWLDSAAFAVIQDTAALKGVSWAGAAHTMTQGAVHLLAAVAAGLAVDAGGLMLLPPAAFLLFLVALPLLSEAGAAAAGPGALLAAPLYAVGISLYSVALVAYPASRGDEPGLVPRRWRAALLFGVAGWLGSALGVGMAQDLHRIPAAFLVAAGAVLAASLWLARGSARVGRGGADAGSGGAGSGGISDEATDAVGGSAGDRSGEFGGEPDRSAGEENPGRGRAVSRLVAVPLLFAVAGVAWAVHAPPERALDGGAALGPAGPAGIATKAGSSSRQGAVASRVAGRVAGPVARAAAVFDPAAVARGRRVYVGEGCIHCHSQYVRPGSRDVVAWGPYRPLDRCQRPPLVGNRRQGPDLTNVGNRRSPEWQRLHLIDPRSLVPGSRMPSYAHLFAAGDRRGDDLVAYLSSLGRGTGGERWATVSTWTSAPLPRGSARRGRTAFGRYCAACHGRRGRGDGPLAPAVRRRALDLGNGAFQDVSWSGGDPRNDPAARRHLDRELARVVRFGLPGSPMPGHEWLSPQQVADLVAYLHVLAGDLTAPTGARSAATGGTATP